ncbi:F0F1 ATP synthase subunit A [Candidatus Stoquefichus sp. SB1]|jgi:F-type H+-transporting ATPase subunit a|uniref:F0F1 ATP synthase subunit A n=1 Tax=Candidatus Stoquefichus sp. SB1 TaxID=1658109 RepID=UPI00067EF38B|nr:F0F1 ATP synthase subunit A [Candidatus Stoquefichus sp. SB1]
MVNTAILSTIHIELQVELVFSLIIIAALCLFFIYAGKKVMAADPLQKPKGIVLVCETGIQVVYDYLKSIMPSQFEKNYYPYFAMLFVYLIVANLSGLIGFNAPTSNYSITLAMTLVTFILIQYNALKKKGGLTYIKELVWPPTNILSAVSPLISLSMRLFGNILSGTILMSLVYQFTGWLSGFILPFNILGPILAPVLHAYFDVFAGCIQTLVFVTLSSILISIEAE